MRISPKILRFILNIYPPYFGAGIRVDAIAENWKEIKVSMNLRWYNRNAVNTHFGGSLYSMVDPHLMLMLMQLLGNEYIVWDKSAQIDFLRPGKGKVQAVLTISDKEIDTIIAETKRHAKTMPRFEVQVVDESGQVVALVGKTLYVRRKKQRS